jgi:hypothetical protein
MTDIVFCSYAAQVGDCECLRSLIEQDHLSDFQSLGGKFDEVLSPLTEVWVIRQFVVSNTYGPISDYLQI